VPQPENFIGCGSKRTTAIARALPEAGGSSCVITQGTMMANIPGATIVKNRFLSRSTIPQLRPPHKQLCGIGNHHFCNAFLLLTNCFIISVLNALPLEPGHLKYEACAL
jgi:hypothetical protein